MDKLKLKSLKREITGRKVNRLRKEGILPANVYGKKIKSESLGIQLSDFLKIYEKAGETGLVDLEIENGKKEERTVLISNVQLDPVSDSPIHVDFRQVDLKERITASIPVESEGESPAEKQGVGTVVQHINEVSVEALPTDLPEKFVVDISSLSEVDQAVYAKDLNFDKSKVELKIDPGEIVFKVEPPQKEEVVAPPPAEVVAPTEGEVPAEGVPVEEGEEKQPEEQVKEEKETLKS